MSKTVVHTMLLFPLFLFFIVHVQIFEYFMASLAQRAFTTKYSKIYK